MIEGGIGGGREGRKMGGEGKEKKEGFMKENGYRRLSVLSTYLLSIIQTIKLIQHSLQKFSQGGALSWGKRWLNYSPSLTPLIQFTQLLTPSSSAAHPNTNKTKTKTKQKNEITRRIV